MLLITWDRKPGSFSSLHFYSLVIFLYDCSTPVYAAQLININLDVCMMKEKYISAKMHIISGKAVLVLKFYLHCVGKIEQKFTVLRDRCR